MTPIRTETHPSRRDFLGYVSTAGVVAGAIATGTAASSIAADPLPTTQPAPDWAKIRGFNYQPSFGSTAVEIWIDKFDPAVVERELGLGRRYFPGMNTVRLWLSHDAFIKNPKQFSKNFEATLRSCRKHEIKAIPTLFNNWHSVPDFGGISQEMIGYWFSGFGQKGESANYVFRPYLEAMFGGHASDTRILAWDLCNEPFNSGTADTYAPWLRHTYGLAKKLGAKQPIGVSVGPSAGHLSHVEPCSDVLMIHPYFASKHKWDEIKAFSAKHNKPLLATETCWGSLDDGARVAIVRKRSRYAHASECRIPRPCAPRELRGRSAPPTVWTGQFGRIHGLHQHGRLTACRPWRF